MRLIYLFLVLLLFYFVLICSSFLVLAVRFFISFIWIISQYLYLLYCLKFLCIYTSYVFDVSTFVPAGPYIYTAYMFFRLIPMFDYMKVCLSLIPTFSSCLAQSFSLAPHSSLLPSLLIFFLMYQNFLSVF